VAGWGRGAAQAAQRAKHDPWESGSVQRSRERKTLWQTVVAWMAYNRLGSGDVAGGSVMSGSTGWTGPRAAIRR